MLLAELLQAGTVWKAAVDPAVAKPSPSATPTISPADHFLPCGLPRGAIHEWFTCSNTPEGKSTRRAKIMPLSIITAIARSSLSTRQDNALILWIGKNVWPTPHFLNQAQLLSRSLFIDPPDRKHKLWAIDAALRSSGVAVVVSECEKLTCNVSRRFSLAAKQGNTLGFIIRSSKDLQIPSAAMSRWLVTPAPNTEEHDHARWKIELLKSKGMNIPFLHSGRSSSNLQYFQPQWFLEVTDEVSLSILSNMVDRSTTGKPERQELFKQRA